MMISQLLRSSFHDIAMFLSFRFIVKKITQDDDCYKKLNSLNVFPLCIVTSNE